MFRVKKVKPLFTGIITTARVYSEDIKTDAGIVLGGTKMAGSMNPYQYVVAVGPMVTGIKEGDVVCINFKRYLVPTHLPGKIENNIQKDNMVGSYEIPMITIDGIDYLFLQNNDIEYVVEEYDGIEDGGLLE